MMDLSADIIGTNPKNPSVVDHTWMDPNPPGYDNFPSDNNPVRVLPKLSELWRTSDVGFSVTPNQANALMGANRAATEAAASVPEVSREARKAAMAGLSGAGLADHLRGMFSPRQIEAAKDELAKVAAEMGLLGNVYIDASAFSTLDEADKFLGKYRSRLARDMVYDPKVMNQSVIARIASKYRKAAVSEVHYDTDLFNHYKEHLVTAGRIPADFVIDSKESLRKAFQYEMPKEEAAPAPVVQTRKLSSEEISEGLRQLADRNAKIQREASDVNLMKVARPVVAFVQENLSKGKTGKDLKDMIRLRFATEDINVAGKFIALAVSDRGLTADHIDERVAKGQISELVGDELKKIGKQFPVKKQAAVEVPETQPMGRFAGVQGSYHAPLAPSRVVDDLSPYSDKAFEALRQGIEPVRILGKLTEKVGAEKAGRILSDAVAKMNSQPSGAMANRASRRSRGPVESLTASSPLPPAEQATREYEEVVSFFKGSGELPVEITAEPRLASVDVEDLSNSNGIDAMLGG